MAIFLYILHQIRIFPLESRPRQVDLRNFQSFFPYFRVANLSHAGYLVAPVQVFDLMLRLKASPSYLDARAYVKHFQASSASVLR